VASFIIVNAIVLAILTLDFVQGSVAHAVEALRRSVAVTASVRPAAPCARLSGRPTVRGDSSS